MKKEFEEKLQILNKKQSLLKLVEELKTETDENKKAVILENEQIVFLRTVSNLPDCFTEKEWEERTCCGGRSFALLRRR